MRDTPHLVESEMQAFINSYVGAQPSSESEEGGRSWENKHAGLYRHIEPAVQRLYLNGRHLLNRLPIRKNPAMDIDLTHLRVSTTGDHDVSLEPEGEQVLPPVDDGGGDTSRIPGLRCWRI